MGGIRTRPFPREGPLGLLSYLIVVPCSPPLQRRREALKVSGCRLDCGAVATTQCDSTLRGFRTGADS